MASAIADSGSDDDRRRRASSGVYGRDKRSVIGWALATLGAAAVGAIGYAHGKLWDHDGSLKVLQERDASQEKRLDKMDDKLDRILERLGAPKP